MEIKIEKTFIGDFGIPLTLFCMNDKDPETYAKQFFRTGIEENDNFMIKDYGKYRGVNFVWQVMMDAKPEDIRKFFKSKDLFGHVDNFREEGKSTWQWKPVIRSNITEFVYDDIVKLLEKGIKLEINGNSGRIGIREGAYHFVGMEWFKAAYIQCYNEDNGIKKDCFITTAVCDSFGKADDCYELTTFLMKFKKVEINYFLQIIDDRKSDESFKQPLNDERLLIHFIITTVD